MNPPSPRQASSPFTCCVKRVCFALLFVALAALSAPWVEGAHPSLEQIAKRWTGIEKDEGLTQAFRFTLDLQLGPKATGGQAKLPDVVGTWTWEPLVQPKGVRVPAQVTTVTGDYHPHVGMLLLFIKHAPGRMGGAFLVVFDEAATRLAGHPAGWPTMPFYANAGEGFGPELAGIVGQRATQPAAPTTMGDAALLARRASIERELVAARPKLYTFTREQLLAEKARLAAALRSPGAQVHELNRQYLEVETELRAPVAARPRQLEPVERWVLQVVDHGESLRLNESPAILAPLFCRRFFEPHFGKPYLAMTAAERQRVAKALEELKRHPDSLVVQSRWLGSLVAVFANKPAPGFDSIYAGVASLALDHIDAWDARWAGELAKLDDPERMSVDLGLFRGKIGKVGWPVRVEAANRHLAEVYSTVTLNNLLARLERDSAVAMDGDWARHQTLTGGSPIVQLVQAGKPHSLQGMSEADRARFLARREAVLDEVFGAAFAAARPLLIDGPPSVRTLAHGVSWYRKYGQAMEIEADRPIVRDFLAEWRAARAKAAEHAAEELARGMDAARSESQLDEFIWSVRLAPRVDDPKAAGWRMVADKVEARRKAIAWERHVARVGEGPFRPDHPGAAYLNAIWRNDHEQIRREDALYLEPLRSQMGGPLNSGILEAMKVMGLGMGMTVEQMREKVAEQMRRASLVRVVAAAFILEYEFAYEQCAEWAKGYSRHRLTTQWRQEWGRFIRVEEFRIKDSHERAFLNLQAEAPGSSVMLERFRKDDAIRVSDLIEGTQRAMYELGCDHPDMKRFEANLLAMFEERFLR